MRFGRVMPIPLDVPPSPTIEKKLPESDFFIKKSAFS
jgi:hypothetical protein